MQDFSLNIEPTHAMRMATRRVRYRFLSCEFDLRENVEFLLLVKFNDHHDLLAVQVREQGV